MGTVVGANLYVGDPLQVNGKNTRGVGGVEIKKTRIVRALNISQRLYFVTHSLLFLCR